MVKISSSMYENKNNEKKRVQNDSGFLEFEENEGGSTERLKRRNYESNQRRLALNTPPSPEVRRVEVLLKNVQNQVQQLMMDECNEPQKYY